MRKISNFEVFLSKLNMQHCKNKKHSDNENYLFKIDNEILTVAL